MVSAAAIAQVLAASAFAGAVGAVLGAGVGAVVRNLGGAVTAAVLLLIVIPPTVMQLVNEAAAWVPSTLANVVSGVGDDVALWAALAVLAAWAIVPAAIGIVTVHRRDVV
jgi:hypothetical protein